MSVSTHHPSDGSHGAQDDLDQHGWPDWGQVNWEDLENLWQTWLASGQAHHWHELSASWRGDDHVAADGVDEARDVADHEHQGPHEDKNAPNAEEHDGNEHGRHHGRGHGDQSGNPAAAPDPEANEHHHQHELADGVDEARDGADHEHQGSPDDDNAPDAEEHDSNEHGRHHGRNHGDLAGGDDLAGGAAPDPEADERHHQHELADGVHEARDGAEREDGGQPGDHDDNTSEHGPDGEHVHEDVPEHGHGNGHGDRPDDDDSAGGPLLSRH